MSAFVIDAFELCRAKGRLVGEFKLTELPRLAQESVGGVGIVRWSLQGDVDKRGHSKLMLSVSGSVQLSCQRCLAPLEFEVQSDSKLALAQDEASADEMDDLLSDESIEVVVGSKAFNIQELIEDEALLAIPSSPKHDSCSSQALPGDDFEVGKASPFAVLKELKQ